ncbi:MAG: MFS transporter [Patescibacteria group bacterium]|nr:MFS transporter [Patescibacteria group bacterium]
MRFRSISTSPWFYFVLVGIAQFMVVLDISITNVALPTIQKQLHFSIASLQWIVTAYALTFGGFLLLGGRTADLFGRRKTLLFGISAFTIASFFVGISKSANLLILLRALQGLSAAFMSPSALSIIIVTFKDGAARNRALAYWTLIASGGAAVGLLLGGVLTQYFSWRWNFFINVPVGIVIASAIYNIIPRDTIEDLPKHLDMLGAVLITAALMLQVLVFSEGTQWGWISLKTGSIFGLSLLLLLLFLINESKSKHPIMPLSFLKIRNVVGANAMMAPMYGTMLGMFFLTTLYVQNSMKFSPSITGLSFLPFPLILAFMSTRIPNLVSKWGFRRFLIIGPLITGIAVLYLSTLPIRGDYFINLLPTFILMPIGVGMTFMPIFAAATSGVPSHEAGLASGLINTSQQMGGSLGLAILSSVASAVTMGAMRTHAAGAQVLGFDRAYLAASGLMTIAAIIAATVIKQAPRSDIQNSETIVAV